MCQVQYAGLWRVAAKKKKPVPVLSGLLIVKETKSTK